MRYVDTSVLVSYLTPEPHSQTAEAFMLSAGGMLVVSSWTDDSLHLAIASAHGSTVYTLDRKMAAAGPKLGVPVILL
ncbi:hypothetical protein [Duganella radicis]|uniref:hypothetical protein n=1 Tax=Duganella radicis TaxID=551988 RepID=UPI001BA6FFAA|nr:hypothetical protein [Duganella radicis]